MEPDDFETFVRFEEMGPGLAFERHLEELFRRIGYKVRPTARVGDFGADLIIEREDQRILVQAKKWSQRLGIEAIQEAAAGRAHYDCQGAIVVTTSYFTEAAKTLARSNRVELWDRSRYLREARQAMLPGIGSNPGEAQELRSNLARLSSRFTARLDAYRQSLANLPKRSKFDVAANERNAQELERLRQAFTAAARELGSLLESGDWPDLPSSVVNDEIERLGRSLRELESEPRYMSPFASEGTKMRSQAWAAETTENALTNAAGVLARLEAAVGSSTMGGGSRPAGDLGQQS